MINAKEELLEHVEDRKVLAICIRVGDDCDLEERYYLETNYTVEYWNMFLECLDFEYDNDYGTQELFGIIWYADGSWSERYEYDGSECWKHKTCPPIANTY